jgi:hypothetical protein
VALARTVELHRCRSYALVVADKHEHVPSARIDRPTKWEQGLYAFPTEKHRHSGSMRTVQSYSRILNHLLRTASMSRTAATNDGCG